MTLILTCFHSPQAFYSPSLCRISFFSDFLFLETFSLGVSAVFTVLDDKFGTMWSLNPTTYLHPPFWVLCPLSCPQWPSLTYAEISLNQRSPGSNICHSPWVQHCHPPSQVNFFSKSYCITHTHTHTHTHPGGLVVRNLPANVGDIGLIAGSGRSPGEGNGNPLQYSCLGNPMSRRAWQATMESQKSWTQLNEWTTTKYIYMVVYCLPSHPCI